MIDETDDIGMAVHRAENGYQLFGDTLRPWSQSRKDAAEIMGLQYPILTMEDAESLRTRMRYPAIKRDVAITLWLATRRDAMDLEDKDRQAGEWTPERAFMAPQAALLEAMVWANEQKWGDSKTVEFTEAAQVAFAMIMDVNISEFSAKVEGGNGAEKKMASTPSRSGRKGPRASKGKQAKM